MTAVAWHLLRGLGAVALVAAALLPNAGPSWAAILLLPAAALLLRGCPMCWLLGLTERVRALLGPRSKRYRWRIRLAHRSAHSVAAAGHLQPRKSGAARIQVA